MITTVVKDFLCRDGIAHPVRVTPGVKLGNLGSSVSGCEPRTLEPVLGPTAHEKPAPGFDAGFVV
jgi:hypothetical protein